MKRVLIAALAAVTLTSGAALAQGIQPNGTRAGGPGQAGIPGEIGADQRTYLRGYVMRQPGSPVTLQDRFVPGYVVPPTVELSPFADDVYGTVPGARSYRYVRSGSGVVLVDPTTRQVVDVID